MKMILLLKPMSNLNKLDQLILDMGPGALSTYDLSGQFTHPQQLARNMVKNLKAFQNFTEDTQKFISPAQYIPRKHYSLTPFSSISKLVSSDI
jgi:hypothetical protein